MYLCTNCKHTSETPENFCPVCGHPMTQQAAAEPAVVTEPVPTAEPVVAAEPVPAAAPAAEQQPAYAVQPQYQYVQPQAPTSVAPPSKAKVIVGMVLSIAGLAMAALGMLYTLIFMATAMATAGIVAFGVGLVFFLFSLPLALVSLILSQNNLRAGSASNMSSVGKKLGIVGVALSGALLFLACISLGASM